MGPSVGGSVAKVGASVVGMAVVGAADGGPGHTRSTRPTKARAIKRASSTSVASSALTSAQPNATPY